MNFYKSKSIFFILILTLILPVFSIAADSIYVWSNSNESIQTNLNISSDKTNSLNLESGSAILIEQNSRSNSLRTQYT